jgi:hypothetical protein
MNTASDIRINAAMNHEFSPVPETWQDEDDELQRMPFLELEKRVLGFNHSLCEDLWTAVAQLKKDAITKTKESK